MFKKILKIAGSAILGLTILMGGTLNVSAQVFSQSQVILSPFGSNGFVVSTTTANGAKLSATSSPYFLNYTFSNATGTAATTTNFKTGTLCLGSDCRTVWPTDPNWTFSGGYLTPTSTNVGLLINAATSTLTNFNSINGTTTNATSTNLYVSGQFRVASLIGLLAGNSGVTYAVSTTSMNASITGSAGSVANSLSHGLTLTGTSFNGSASVSNWDVDLTHGNTWSALQQFTANASTSMLSVANGSATTTILATATSTFAAGISATYLNLTGASSATSTSSNGLDLSGGCFSILGTCLQTYIQNATAYKSAANYATAAVLAGTPTYANGTAGVGATLTEVGVGAVSIDGNAPVVGNRVLVKDQADQTQNGVYTVTIAGSGIASYVLTRATDFNTTNDVYAGVTVPVLSGTANAGTSWVQTTTGAIVIGTSNIVFAEGSAAGGGVTSAKQTYGTAQTGPITFATTSNTTNGITSSLTVTNSGGGFTFGPSQSGTLAVLGGGTGVASFTANSLLYSNSAGTALAYAATSTLNIGGNAGTATALAANPTNCSAGNYPLGVDAGGNVENCTAAGAGGTGLATTSPTASSNVLVYSSAGAGSAYGAATTTLAGTGILSISNSPIVLGASGAVASITGGSNGQVLGWLSGVPTWTATTSLATTSSNGGWGFTGQGTQTLNIPTASATNPLGLLSSADWTTFNGKGSGSVTSITLGGGLDGATPITTTGTILAQVGTSSVPTQGNLAYWTGVATPSTLGTVATTTLVGGGPITVSNSPIVIGGSSAVLGCATCLTANQSITLSGVVTGTGATAITTAFGSQSAGVLGNSITGNTAVQATSTLYGVAPYGSLLSSTGSVIAWLATSSLMTGTTGQVPYFTGTNTLFGTSSLFINTLGSVGVGSTTPWATLSVGSGTASTSIVAAEYKYSAGSNLATSTTQTLDARTGNQIHWRLGSAATTLTLCNFVPGQHLVVVIENPSGGVSGALTWASCAGTILLWNAGTVPTQTTTANKQDVWSFLASQGSSTLEVLGAQTANF